ncbi:MAG: hypothetical protein M0Z70_08045 [Nitrospiraceae bacterium]|nr:hypothetical protein [Nitrospirota bacterium]MDA8339233.1 hypothetical protein [Nitrospiraceae bacterium]
MRTHQNYLSTWCERLERYRSEFIQKDKIIRAKDEQFGQIELAKVSDPWSVLISHVLESSIMIREAFTIAGRGEMIKAFIIFMETNPTPGLADVWFLRQTEDLRREEQDVIAKTKSFFASFEEKIRQGPEWVLEVEAIAKAQGMIAGKIEELQSLYKQAISYYKDMHHARIEEQRIAQTLMITGMYLIQLNYQQQLINTLNRPRTCVFVGNVMTCY